MRKSLDVFNNKSESRKFSFLGEKSYNKTFIDFNFGRHQDLSTLKSDNSPRPDRLRELSLFRVDKS